jgi:molybdopterin-guanine dinucleotide biosynthesis protein A
MGRDKALMPWEGGTLLERALDRMEPLVDEVLVIGEPSNYGYLGPFVLADEWPGKGPLGGIATAMRYASNDRLLVTACDMPGVTPELLRMLQQLLGSGCDAVVPTHGGQLEPLVAAYHRDARPVFRRNVELDLLRMDDALKQVRTKRLEVLPGSGGWPADLFRNLNRPEDLG